MSSAPSVQAVGSERANMVTDPNDPVARAIAHRHAQAVRFLLYETRNDSCNVFLSIHSRKIRDICGLVCPLRKCTGSRSGLTFGWLGVQSVTETFAWRFPFSCPSSSCPLALLNRSAPGAV